jgi:hypothetical protein
MVGRDEILAAGEFCAVDFRFRGIFSGAGGAEGQRLLHRLRCGVLDGDPGEGVAHVVKS